MVKTGREINLEYVASDTELKIYPVSHSGSDLPLSDVKVTASSKAPKAKEMPLKLEAKEGAYVAKLDFKNAYRLEVKVNTESTGKKDSFTFQVEK